MKPDTRPECPFHAGAAARPLDQSPAPSIWPPGPASGLGGWGLLRAMSRDPLGAFERWRRQHGDVVHLRIWPEHHVVLTDPALVRDLLVTQHEHLLRWERGIAVMSQLHGRSVLTAEGRLWRTRRQALQPRVHAQGGAVLRARHRGGGAAGT